MSDNIPPIESNDPDYVQPGYLGPTPPLGQPPRRGERLWVDRPERLQHAVNILKQARIVAIDAEFTQVRARTQNEVVSTVPRLALLQLAIERHCFVVDTLRLNDLSPLAEVLENPETVVLLHGAGADIRVMAERGLNVRHYYDLEATCRSIFGQHESSLAAMLQRAFNIRLDKSLQRTDWTRRPLPPAMIAYAARDAEVTLALYKWLDQYYPHILQLHDNTRLLEPVAAWIEPFLRGSSLYSPEVAVADALTSGALASKAQIARDCGDALNTLTHPIRRNRLLRLITDLSLIQLAPDIIPLLQAPTSDERAGSVRALGRLSIKSAQDALRPLLHDPVQDVRKAAALALRNLSNKEPRQSRAAPTKNADGSRRWTITAANEQQNTDDENGWKARLRAMMDQ
ncbi:MAG TPA: HEAT repeat domain-containing protein [Ktedonobacteraceae bacterium]|nr:HEAT repeat domain-containing protein [Ktedonobacteraceae bacterium]